VADRAPGQQHLVAVRQDDGAAAADSDYLTIRTCRRSDVPQPLEDRGQGRAQRGQSILVVMSEIKSILRVGHARLSRLAPAGARHDRARAGYWTFPGGYVELGEARKEAAVREAKEERASDVASTGCSGLHSGRQLGRGGSVRRHDPAGEPQPLHEVDAVGFFHPDAAAPRFAFKSTWWALEQWALVQRDRRLPALRAQDRGQRLAGARPAG